MKNTGGSFTITDKSDCTELSSARLSLTGPTSQQPGPARVCSMNSTGKGQSQFVKRGAAITDPVETYDTCCAISKM